MKKTSVLGSPPLLFFSAQKWLFPVLVVWVSFVFIFFFAKLYAGLDGFANFFSTSAFSPALVDFSKRLNVWKESFLALATGFLVMGIFWSCGKRLFHWLSLEAPRLIRFCLELGLGIFLLSSLWMGLGLVRLWVESLWLTGFILLTFMFLKDLLVVYRKGFEFTWPMGMNLWLFLICAFYFVFLLLHSVLPETFYDSLNYFLGMPSFWLWHHGICDYPTHLLSGYFHGGSLFFLNGFVLAGTEGGKVLAALVLFWIALACYSWAKELSGPKAGAVAATAVLTFPLLYLNSWAVRVDGLLTFVLLLFFYTLEKGVSLKKGERRWIVVAGIFAGLALSIKPTAVVAIAAALCALLWRDFFLVLKKKGWMIFAGILALEVGPWFLKNFCFTGNPFFPYAVPWMGGRTFPAWSQERLLHENQQFLRMENGIGWLGSVLSLPWRFTIPGAGDDQFIGPLLLAFLPLFFLFRYKNPTLKFLGRTLLISFLFGLTLSHMLRFSMPAFILAFLVLSIGFEILQIEKWKFLWVGAIVASGFLCFGQYLSLSANWYDGWGIWSGGESRQEYVARKTVYGQKTQWVNKNLSKDSRILFVGDAQVLYFERPPYANSVFDEQFFAIAARNEKDPEGIFRRLKDFGITHIVIHEVMGGIHSKEYRQYELNKDQWRKIDDFVREGLEPLMVDGGVCIYQVREKLLEKGSFLPDPFYMFPIQWWDFHSDLDNKNYIKAKLDLNELKIFFPGDPHWLKDEIKLSEMEKAK